jgi:hypothetical protein
MKAGIITTPNRQMYLTRMVKQIAPFVDSLHIYNDLEKKGQPYNMRRCMRELLTTAKKDEQVLIMCDDAITVNGWYNYLQALIKAAPSEVYCLFNRKRHLFKEENLAKGYAKGVFKGAFYDQATVYINQQHLPDALDQFLIDNNDNPKFHKHYDDLTQGYLVDNNIEWVVSTPTLFEHIGDDTSTLGHKIGRSFNFIGNK